MKPIITTFVLALAFVLGGCSNTWSGVKQDTKNAGQATGKGIEKTGEKIQEISK